MPEKLKRTNDGCYFERGVDSIADAAVEAVNAYKHWTNSDEGGAPVDRAIDTLKATLTTEGFAEEVEEVEEVEEKPAEIVEVVDSKPVEETVVETAPVDRKVAKRRFI